MDSGEHETETPNSSTGQTQCLTRGKTDPAWAHCTEIPSEDKKKRSTLVCLYCAKEIKGGGINRVKQHLAGIKSEVASCKKVSAQIRFEMKKAFESTSYKKKGGINEQSASYSLSNLRDYEEEQYMQDDTDVQEIQSPHTSTNDKGKKVVYPSKKMKTIDSVFMPRTTPGAQPSIKSVLQSKAAKEKLSTLLFTALVSSGETEKQLAEAQKKLATSEERWKRKASGAIGKAVKKAKGKMGETITRLEGDLEQARKDLQSTGEQLFSEVGSKKKMAEQLKKAETSSSELRQQLAEEKRRAGEEKQRADEAAEQAEQAAEAVRRSEEAQALAEQAVSDLKAKLAAAEKWKESRECAKMMIDCYDQGKYHMMRCLGRAAGEKVEEFNLADYARWTLDDQFDPSLTALHPYFPFSEEEVAEYNQSRVQKGLAEWIPPPVHEVNVRTLQEELEKTMREERKKARLAAREAQRAKEKEAAERAKDPPTVDDPPTNSEAGL